MPSPYHRRRADDFRIPRYLTPLPRERLAELPFVVTRSMIIAPWPAKRASLEDEDRLEAVLDGLDLASLPAAVCWCWPDRDPMPVENDDPGWLAAQARDRAVYALE